METCESDAITSMQQVKDIMSKRSNRKRGGIVPYIKSIQISSEIQVNEFGDSVESILIKITEK